jgi:hypothetical protein
LFGSFTFARVSQVGFEEYGAGVQIVPTIHICAELQRVQVGFCQGSVVPLLYASCICASVYPQFFRSQYVTHPSGQVPFVGYVGVPVGVQGACGVFTGVTGFISKEYPLQVGATGTVPL